MAITDEISVPGNINQGLRGARNSTWLEVIGPPAGRMTNSRCHTVTNARLSDMLVFGVQVGPQLRVSGMRPAVDSLKEVMTKIEARDPEMFRALSSAGMLCARLVRGSSSTISNHAWGTAVDLQVNGVLDDRGDNRVLEGLARIAPIFNEEGWFWGAGFRTEDAMHFELSEEKIRDLAARGEFGPATIRRPNTVSVNGMELPVLRLGAMGIEVRDLQNRLNIIGQFGLAIDGDFGPRTSSAVISFQASRRLDTDGIVGLQTWTQLIALTPGVSFPSS